MTNTQKARALDIAGAVISFAAPSAAAIAEFPHIRTATAGTGTSFLDVLNLSAAAFSIVCICAALTLWRFFSRKIKLPKTGIIPCALLTAVCYGVEQFIHSMTIIMAWATFGAFAAMILYHSADKVREAGNEQ